MTSRREKVSPTRPSRRSEWKRWPSIADDAGRLLAAMLKRVQAERRDGGRVRMAVDAEHAAFLAQPIAVVVLSRQMAVAIRVRGNLESGISAGEAAGLVRVHHRSARLHRCPVPALPAL